METEVFDDEIVSIEYQGEEETFDISMKAPWHNYIASNLIVHNTVGMQKFSAGLNISSFPDLYDATTLFRPSCLHCVSGETRIRKQKGNIRLKELYRLQEEDKKLPKILDGKGIPKTPIKIWKNGKQQLFELQVNHAHTRWGGNKIFATSKHKFLTDSGWKTLGELKEGDEVYVLKRKYPKWSKEQCKKLKGRIPWNKGKKMSFAKEEDARRDRELKEVGWRTIRINKNNFKKFREDFKNGIY